MGMGDIKTIADQTGNHWRKVFNVYAKLAFQLNNEGYASWQILRDQSLLQPGSPYALLFSEPLINATNDGNLHIVMGKGYATQLGLMDDLVYVDEAQQFAISSKQRLILCPYFDYRQLSNAKIDTLVELMGQVALVSYP